MLVERMVMMFRSAIEWIPESTGITELIGNPNSCIIDSLKYFRLAPPLTGLDGFDIMKHPDLGIGSIAFEKAHGEAPGFGVIQQLWTAFSQQRE